MKQIFVLLFLVFVSCKNDKQNNLLENKESDVSNETILEKDSSEQDLKLKSEIALSFINDYVENSNKLKESIGIIEWVNANQYSSDNLKTELERIMNEAEKQAPEYGLGFDPIFDAQDFPEDGFEIDEVEMSSNFLTVKGKNWKDFKITLKVKKESDKWLVDGVGIINIPKDKQSER